MPNQRYQSIRTFSVSLLVMSLFLLGASMVTPTPVAAQADLELTKTCESIGALGGSFHLTLRENEDGGGGGGTATDVVVTDWIPEFIKLTGWQGDGSFDLETGVWTVGTVMTGTAKTLWIDFAATEQGEFENHAEVTNQVPDDYDSVPSDGMGDDYDSCSFVIVDRGVPDFVPEKSPGGITNRGNRFSADLEATKVVDVETASVNGQVHYTVWIENLGPHSTAKVQATDHLPDCLTDASWDDPPPTRGTYDGWLWDIGALKVGEKVKLEVWATVGSDCSGTVTNGVWITRSTLPDPSIFFNVFDEPPPTLKNNHAEASFRTPNAVMNDRFATQKGANGSAIVALTQKGGIKIGQVKMWGLSPNQPHLVQVTVVPPGGDFTPDGATVHPKAVTTDNDGHFEINDFDLGVFPPGVGYRVDIFVTTDPASGVGAAGVGVFLTSILGGDPLAACQPFWVIEVTGATGFARVEIDRGGQVLDGTTFALGNNYPNPFNPTTMVPFSLAEASHVSIRVYDLLGREVETLVDQAMASGVHEVVFEANNLSTGVYLIRMEAAGLVQIQRVTLMK